ncbi:59_t:CDS:2, partial [Funneliformis geosporum]
NKIRKDCPKEPKKVWEIIDQHLQQLLLIPNFTGNYLTSIQIREQAWYNYDCWELWARSAYENNSIPKKTMFIEGH